MINNNSKTLKNQLYLDDLELELQQINEKIEKTSLVKSKKNNLLLAEKYSHFKSENKIKEVTQCYSSVYYKLEEHRKTKERRTTIDPKYIRTCKDRFCQLCQTNKMIKQRKFVTDLLTEIKQDKNRLFHLTLTVKNCDISRLKSTKQKMDKAFIRFTSKLKFIIGTLKYFEFTVQEDLNTAHPHFHIILTIPESFFIDMYDKNEALTTEENNYLKWLFIRTWKKCLKVDYQPVVNVREIAPEKITEEELKKGINEVVGYALKMEDILNTSQAFFERISKQVKGLRFYSGSGIIKKALSGQDLDNLPDTEESLDELWEYLFHIKFDFEDNNYQPTNTFYAPSDKHVPEATTDPPQRE